MRPAKRERMLNQVPNEIARLEANLRYWEGQEAPIASDRGEHIRRMTKDCQDRLAFLRNGQEQQRLALDQGQLDGMG